MENIKDTKYELFENLTDGGEGFFCSDNKYALELAERFKGEKYFAGTKGFEDNLVWATDIVTDWHGTSFNLCIRGEEPVRCATVLLGEHSIRNICLAAAVAYKIGMTAKEIAFGIIRIQSVGHRLEIMPNNKGIVIIDDSYNANIDGAEAAMQVLDMFDGRKIVVTPGLVELGKEENALNIEYGKMLAKHADKVIIVGRHNAEMILSGLIDGGMKKEDIRFAKNLNRGNTELNKMLKAGDIVLFENDLPDNYN
jgi:UDP-N-acetylmuramoyl-tripeptide--D-alanyl-D-alanine ligase